MKKGYLILVAFGFLATCATIPTPRQIQNSFPIDRPFDPVWQAVIEVFAEVNYPIANMEKASGLIVLDWVSFRGENDKTGCCDCGKTGIYFEADRRGKVNVYIKKMSDVSCEIKINIRFEQIALFGNSSVGRECISTGKLEAEIYRRIQEKLK